MADSKKVSRLGDSLLKSIEGSNSNKVSKNSVQDAFSSTDGKSQKQAFSEIDSSNNEDTENGGSNKPERIKTKKSANRNGSIGSLLGGTALVISILAASGAGYAIFKQQGIEFNISESIESIELTMGELVSRSDNFTAELKTVKNDVEVNSVAINDLASIHRDIQSLQNSISTINQITNRIKQDLKDYSNSIQKNSKSIGEIQGKIKKLSAKPRRVVRRPIVQPKIVRPVLDKTKLEGASVASIDIWGAAPYVVLREPDGNWIPLSMGDYYRGWRFSGAVGKGAMFKKGSQKRTLFVEE